VSCLVVVVVPCPVVVVVSCRVLSCPVVSCRVVSCPVVVVPPIPLVTELRVRSLTIANSQRNRDHNCFTMCYQVKPRNFTLITSNIVMLLMLIAEPRSRKNIAQVLVVEGCLPGIGDDPLNVVRL
jgi:hypothetical protein